MITTKKNLSASATKQCEAYLHDDKQYNEDQKILPSECRIIDRMLRRSDELQAFYAELHEKLDPGQCQRALSTIVTTAAFWHPDAAKQARDAKKRLEELNLDIGRTAGDLARLIRRRSALSEQSTITAHYEYHIASLIDSAADEEGHGHYHLYLKPELERLRAQYDLKYWPSIEGIVEAIARDSGAVEIHPSDPITAAATSSPRSSRADFFHGLFQNIDQQRERIGSPGELPLDFRLTDASLADVANVTLNLGPDQLVSPDYVKRLRQRARERDDNIGDLKRQ